MPKLTVEQTKLLIWMKTGRTFRVCTGDCHLKGDVQPKSRLPIKVFQKTINKLTELGLITPVNISYFGVGWNEYSLTEKGKEAAVCC